jgi:circadian clock protein KaiB
MSAEPEPPEPRWSLTLYVNGASPRSVEAIVTVRRFCDEDLQGRVDLTIVNAVDHPAMVVRENILALPTLVKHSPQPLRHLVGNLADVGPPSSSSSEPLPEGLAT